VSSVNGTVRSQAGAPAAVRFVLYVEGPSDCDILRTWARLVSAPLSKKLSRCSVILGGRRPARAVEHFRSLVQATDSGEPVWRGLCVLDRDGHARHVADDTPDGLEFFTWSRRHIESYLLVPGAMRRCLRMPAEDPRLAGVLGDLHALGSDEGLRDVDAKRLLASRSALARERGALLSPARIARCMNRGDLHPDVLELLDRVRDAAGLPRSFGR
jgi:hypothetical protein